LAIGVFVEFVEFVLPLGGGKALAELEAALTDLQFLDLGIKR